MPVGEEKEVTLDGYGHLYRTPTGMQFPIPKDRDMVFLCVPQQDIPHLAGEYLEVLKTARTIDWCACKWDVHPDDVDFRPGIDDLLCKMCKSVEPEHPVAYETSYIRPGTMQETVKTLTCNTFQARQRRLHRSEDSPVCPMHTELGRILGFFQYLFPQEKGNDGTPTGK